MSCFADQDAKMHKRISMEIDRQLKRQRTVTMRELKLLLLGTGEAGKSTFIKQMRIIHGTGYTLEDRIQYRELVYRNVMIGMQALIGVIGKLGLKFQNPESQQEAERLVDIDTDSLQSISPAEQQAVITLWSDEEVKTCFHERRSEFQISDSAKYYFEHLERVFADDYVPSVQDILRVRVPTTGINEYPFRIKNHVIRIMDVGGQRSERRKWIHCFDSVNSVIFLVAMSEYDQFLYEVNEKVNRLKESLALFETVVNYPWFKESSFILFLNKKDLLEDKIMNTHLVDHFPNYSGSKYNYIEARQFIAELFRNKARDRKEDIFYHFTCATDTENIRFIFDSVKTHIMQESIKSSFSI